jgi:competence protein ComEC
LPLLWLSIAFVAGLGLGSWLPWGISVWVGISAAAAILSIPERIWIWRLFPVLQRLKWLRVPLLLLVCAAGLGAWRYSAAKPVWDEHSLAWYNGSGSLTIQGMVAAPPEISGRTVYLTLDRVSISVNQISQAVHGRLRATLPAGAEYRYGDLLELQGALQSPAKNSSPSYQAYLANRGIYSLVYYPKISIIQRGTGSPLLAALYSVQERGVQVVNQIMPQPEAALLSGILLGDDHAMPDDLVKAYQVTGTAHIIAISGFNIAILIALFVAIFSRAFSRTQATGLTMLVIILYTLLVGASASVVRAAIMGSVGLLGSMIGRRQVGANTLAFTAAVMCVVNPLLPWDASFQLSFLATLGLVLFAEPLQTAFLRLIQKRLPENVARQVGEWVGEYLLMTLAAQLMTLPVMVNQFQQVSWSSLIANPLVLPAQPLVMILGGAAVLAGIIFIPLGKVLGAVAWPLLAYTNRMVEALARLPGGAFAVQPVGGLFIACYFALLVFLFVILPRLPKIKPYLPPTGFILAAALLAGFGARTALAAPDGYLRVTIYPGKTPALIIQAPAGETVLINSSEQNDALASALGRLFSPIHRSLDGVLLACPSDASLQTLPALLDQYPPQRFFWDQLPDGRGGDNLITYLDQQNIPVSGRTAGQSLQMSGGAALQRLAGGGWLLTWKNFRLALPCGEKNATFLPGSVLLLGETDLKNNSPQQWLAGEPVVVVAALGEDEAGVPWLSAAQHGWVKITSDGQRMWLEVERK